MNFTFGVSGYLWNTAESRQWNGADSVGKHSLLGSMAWSHPNDNLEVYNFGLEYGYQNTLFFRAGKKVNGFTRKGWEDYQKKIADGVDASSENPFYEYPLFSKSGSFFGNGATLGAGLRFPSAGLQLDYAYTGIAYLDSIHRFSISDEHILFI
jgi:hypothetical protein